ncbi:hypothetical protein Lfee_1262 [Legionella feeleii]|uniref:Uncharacterized protein n=1 Tax=Legionella feeleii TaxID=453 RepID=A0A0W0TX27_9GAMM|nr:hypothetical protein Lfee_1262 [Legionella feeleii]SPX60147.1 Uncharacterised protein [Legionella feeleii]
MSILGAVIEPFMGTMLCAFAHLLNRFRITSQFVGYDYSWLGVGVHKACQEADGSPFVTIAATHPAQNRLHPQRAINSKSRR